MNIKVFAAFFLYAVFLLRFSMSAASYTDEIDSLNPDSVKQYSNLRQHLFSGGVSSMPDTTTATFSGARLSAHAQYRVEGATNVTAAIYSNSGTFVSRNPEPPGVYMLGIFMENMDFIAGQDTPQAFFCESTNGVYTYEGGLKQMFMNIGNTYEFGGVVIPPSGSVTGYGVNIYYSFDGQQFVRVPARLSSLKFDAMKAYCYEQYTAELPESAKYIRAEINDVSSVPLAGGGFREKSKSLKTALASVMITGNKLVMGEPESKIAATLPDDAQNAEEEYYSAERDLLAKAEKSETTKSGEASSKFEGTITSSSKSGRAPSSSKPKKKGGTEDSAASSSETDEQSEIAPDETIVHNIHRASEKTGFNSGVTAYIIIVSGVIVMLAVLQKRK